MQTQKTPKKAVSLTLDEYVVKALKPMAAESGRSLSRYINRLLRFWLEIQRTM